MRKINLTSKCLVLVSICLISGFALLLSACKSDQSTQSQSGGILPLNNETLDGITNSSIGSAKLSIDTNGYLDVTSMTSMSNGVSTDFSSKSSWVATYTINWPETGSDTIRFNAVDGSTTTSALQVNSSDTSTLYIQPIFTGQIDTVYILKIYNGSTLVLLQSGLGASSNPIKILRIPPPHAFRKSFSPASLVMGNSGAQTSLIDNSSSGTYTWQMMSGTGVDSVTTPLGATYAGTMIEIVENVTGSDYTFDHIQQLSNCGTMVIDSVVVN